MVNERGYALGSRITHYCHVDGRYLAVTVDYRDVSADLQQDQDSNGAEPSDEDEAGSSGSEEEPKEVTAGTEAVSDVQASFAELESKANLELASAPEEASSSARYSTPIREIDPIEARAHLRSLFDDVPDSFDEMFERETWTLAVIDQLRDVSIPAGRLGYILAHGMPLRPDFRLFVNEQEIESRLGLGALEEWSFATEEIRTSVESVWKEAQAAVESRRRVDGELEWAPNFDHCRFPALGTVTVEVRTFTNSLFRRGDDDRPRSYGFFVMVRGRLINPDDPLLLLSDPSFATFYRAQFVIHADGLDADLLADRERIRDDTSRARELAVLQKALYRAARAALVQADSDAAVAATTESLLPIDSRELYREPLSALLMHRAADDQPFRVSRPKVVRENLAADGPVSDLNPDGSGFRVNASHPFYESVREKAGTGKKGREFLRVFDLVAVGERLLEGFLLDAGLSDTKVDEVLEWRDQLFRAMARRYSAAAAEVVQAVRESSYLGKSEFEESLAHLFNLMGFTAHRDGASGKKDILVVAPVGPAAFQFTVEAKGSKHAVANDATDIDIAAAHRTESGSSFSVIVAREFSGFAAGKSDPMVLQQLREVDAVSIITVETLLALFDAVQKFSYPLELIVPILLDVEAPERKLARVQQLSDPLTRFDVGLVLDEIWLRQNGEAAGDYVATRQLWQSAFKEGMSYVDFQGKAVGTRIAE